MKKLMIAVVAAAFGAIVAVGVTSVTAEDKKPAAGEPTDKYKDYQKVLKKLRKDMKDFKPNTFQQAVSGDAKQNMMKTMMGMSPWGLREMIGTMAMKRKVAKGVTFEEVIEALEFKANEVNMMKVGHNYPSKLLKQIYDPKTPRLEILSFCDMITLRQIVDVVPEFIIFIPCRIAIMEDASGDIWLVTLDWDVNWLGKNEKGKVPFLTDTLAERAQTVNDAIKAIMDAGAEGSAL